jgi:hypothetical protein
LSENEDSAACHNSDGIPLSCWHEEVVRDFGVVFF